MGRDELRRLQKAAREKDRKHLAEWAEAYEQQVIDCMIAEFEKEYQTQIQSTIDNLIVALAYTLIYSEEWDFNPDNLGDFMSDLFATIDLYRTGEYKPEDYIEDLKKHGLTIDSYDYSKVFKDKDKKYIDLAKQYSDKLDELNKLKLEYETKLQMLQNKTLPGLRG